MPTSNTLTSAVRPGPEWWSRAPPRDPHAAVDARACSAAHQRCAPCRPVTWEVIARSPVGRARFVTGAHHGRSLTDVAIVGGCGHVGLPLAIAFADRGRLGRALRRRRATRSRPSTTAGCRSASPAPPSCSRAVARRGLGWSPRPTRRWSPAPSTSWSSSARPVDEHLNPDPQARPAGHRAAAPSTSATASCSSCAAPSTRASPRMVEQLLSELGLDVDVAFCPERIAEGKAMTSSFELPQIVVRPHASGARERAAQLFRRLTDADRPARAGGGRAGQAVHQHLALHQVRRRQPVLHDRQRLRPRLRAHPAGARRRTTRAPPTCPVPGSPPGRACSRTRCSWRRSTTTTSRSATRHAGQRGPAAVHGVAAGGASTTSST